MFYLSDADRDTWSALAQDAILQNLSPEKARDLVKSEQYSPLCFYIATRLSSGGNGAAGREWFSQGALSEHEGLYSCGFLLGFLERHNGCFTKPAVAFEDPRPYLHFAGVPVMRDSRGKFIRYCTYSLPVFPRPVSFIDLGCGDGGLTAFLLCALVDSGIIPFVHRVLLVDSSPAMLQLAKKTVETAFPRTEVITCNSRIQDASALIRDHYDIAMSSLAFHHMPAEDKAVHLSRIGKNIDHFILFEMGANHDSPECGSPELAYSVYQSYGRIIDFVFSHDTSPEIACACLDNFILTELISILTEPRGIRSDYHTTRSHWEDLCMTAFQNRFTLVSDSSCYADEYMDFFTLHYARNRGA